MKAWMVEMPQWICEIESFVYIFYFQYSLLELTDFFFSTTSEGTCLWQFFFLPLSSISQTFGLIAPIFVRYPLNDVNVWVGLGLTNLNCWEKILQKKTFKKLNFEIITKNIWITNSKTIVSISVKWKNKQTMPYNVNFKINEMLILIFITVFI